MICVRSRKVGISDIIYLIKKKKGGQESEVQIPREVRGTLSKGIKSEWLNISRKKPRIIMNAIISHNS